jgi:beta-lactamase regulating signal transducer with metallopeptidase domain/protocatechuate 3,4-dioxygenase beta subunit
MNTTALSLLETALTYTVHASWQAAVLGVVVWGTCRLLGKTLPPRWRFALWLIVFARLALPVLPASPWSLFQLASVARPEPAIEVPAKELRQDREMPILADPSVPSMPTVSPPSVEAPLRSLEEEERPAVRDSVPMLSARAWLALVWVVGMLLLVGRRSWLALTLARQRRTWHRVEQPRILHVFEQCRRDLRLSRRVELFLAPDLAGPATDGVWRPCIVLPATLVSSFSDEELRLMLLHELLHVRRLDVPSDRLAALLAIAHWFNPIAWLALACLRQERELACDAAVLDRVGSDAAHRYGHLLLKIVEQLHVPAPVPGAVEMFAPRLSLTKRIHMIASHRKPRRTARALGTLLVILLIAVGLTDARIAGRGPGKEDRESDPPRPAAEGAIVLAGVCQDENGAALQDVRVAVYREDFLQLKTERLREGKTDRRGGFRFTDLPALPRPGEHREWMYVLTCTRKGRASVIQRFSAETRTDKLTIPLKPGATLQGRVTDPNGRAVAGAWVWTDGRLNDPLPGVFSSRTDADGHYAITDLTAWDVAKLKPTPSRDGRSMTAISHCYYFVRHPDYGEQRPAYKRVPDTINVTLQPAAIIEGRVLDELTGKPASKVLVYIQGTNSSKVGASRYTRTDEAGKYRFPSLLAASYNISAQAPERTCTAIDSFAVTAGKTHTAPDLKLIEGGWIEGRLIDAETGKPISRDPQSQRRLSVAVYGPARPKSGAACDSSEVDDRGTFRLHVAPGTNFPYIMDWDVWKLTQRREFFQKGIEVKSGEIVNLVFRILPKEPIADPEPSPVRLQLPVADERQAAERIRQLGGWHEVDKDKHIVEVNMVYHKLPDNKRYNNKRTDTDEALRTVKAFPRLRSLGLWKGQATDEGLAGVAGLKDLEVLFIWDAEKITDSGVKHLAGLMKLQTMHINDSRIGDGALEVFARLPALKHLSLQGSAFSDEGLKHLEGMKQLRFLSIGNNRKPITDAGVKHLSGLTQLEQLDLQRTRLSDEGIAALRGLTNLKLLLINGDGNPGSKPITDASVDTLAALTKLEELHFQNAHITERGVKRLSELPKLKTLWLPTSCLSDQTREELERSRPNLRIYLSGPPRQ